MAQRLVVLIAVVLVTMANATDAIAQADYVVQVAAEDAALGSGCNAIGEAVPTAGPPVTATQEWIEAHTACYEGVVMAAQCQGQLVAGGRTEACLLIVVEGDEGFDIDCADIQAYASDSIYGPDATLTGQLKPQLEQAFEGNNLDDQLASLVPCTEDQPMASSTGVLAAFFLDRTLEDVVLRVRVGPDPGDQVHFIVTEPRSEAP